MKAAKVAAVAGVAITLALILGIVLLAPAAPPPAGPLPVPNGYDDLVAAGRGLPPAVPRSEDPGALRAFLEEHGLRLARARQGLGKECRAHEGSAGRFEILDLLQLFRAEGELHEAMGRDSEAAGSFVDLIRAGIAACRGAYPGDLHEIGIQEAYGTIGLRWLIERLDLPAARDLARKLEASLSGWADFEASLSAWKDFRLRNLGPLRRTIEAFRFAVENAPASRSNVEPYYLRSLADVRLALIRLALRAHRLEKGGYPERLEDLVPGFLRALPGDPHSGKPFRYRKDPVGYALHGVGPDGADDGGQGDDIRAF